ncbi:MAG: hypothetical protein U0S48_15730 [Solirubrobacteraceae bacterium]
MSEAAATEFEALLRRALAPVDPPEELAGRVEETLTSITEMAADELESWEIGAMRDPRNWLRPAAAVLAGTTAGVALVVLRTKQRSKQRRRVSRNPLDLAERTLNDAMNEARRLWR